MQHSTLASAVWLYRADAIQLTAMQWSQWNIEKVMLLRGLCNHCGMLTLKTRSHGRVPLANSNLCDIFQGGVRVTEPTYGTALACHATDAHDLASTQHCLQLADAATQRACTHHTVKSMPARLYCVNGALQKKPQMTEKHFTQGNGFRGVDLSPKLTQSEN